MAGQYGTQQQNLKRTAGVVRRYGSPSAVKKGVYGDWKFSTLRDMMANMPRAYQGQAKSLAQAMFPQPAPTRIVPGGPRETNYDAASGTVNIGQGLTPSIPLAAYAHEQSHALQRGPGAQWDDQNFTETERASANELAPTLAGNLAEYEARRRSGGQALNSPTPLTQGYQPSLEWMRQQAQKYGAFSGKPMEQLLAENPQYVRLLAQQAGQQGPGYESGSLTPQSADAFDAGGNSMPTQKKRPWWMGNMELLGASQGSPRSAQAPNRSPEAARALSGALRNDIRKQNAANVEVGNWMNDVEKARQDYEAAQQRLRDSEPQYREDMQARVYGRAPRQMGQPQVPQPPTPGSVAPASGMRPEEIDAKGRLLGTIGNQNPNTESLRSRVRTIDGQQYLANGRPAYGSGARNLQTSRVGAGTQSNGMTGGGAIGSALMMSGAAVPGMPMGGVPQQPRQPAVDPYATAQATKVRMMQSGQRAPTVMQTQEGDTRIIGSGGVMLKPNKEQLANRSAFADAMAGRKAAVQARGMARGQARDERLQFSKDRQQYGQQGALVQAFQRQGVDPMRAMAMVAAMGGDKTAVNYLSEDNRQTRAAGEFSGRTELEKERNAIERDRLTAEIEQGKNAIDPGVVALQQAGQAAYQQAISDGQTEQEAESAAMQASMGKWQRFGTQPMTQPGQSPPGDTPISRAGDWYEAATGLPQWTGLAYGWMPLVPQGLSKVFGSEKRKRDAAKRISQYKKP